MSTNYYKATYILSLFIYGTIGLVLRYISLPVEFVVICRGILGSLTMVIITKLTGKKLDFKPFKKVGKWFVLSGICLGFNWITLFAAYKVTTVAIASLCNYMAPIIVIFLAALLFKDKLKPISIVCIFVAFIGIALVSGVTLDGIAGVNLKGVALGFMAAAGFTGMVLCNKKGGDVPVYEKAIIQLISASLTALPYFLINNWGEPLNFDLQSVLLILLLGVVHSGIAYTFYFGAITKIDVQSFALLGYTEPIVSVLVSVIILHESMTLLGVIGAVMVLGAAIVNEMAQVKKVPQG